MMWNLLRFLDARPAMSSIQKNNGWAVLLAIVVCGVAVESAHAQNFAVGQGVNNQQFGQAPAGNRITNMQAGMPVGGPQLPNPSPPYNPYFPYGGGSYFESPLTGVANTISAQGQLMVNQQDAYLKREQVHGARIAN